MMSGEGGGTSSSSTSSGGGGGGLNSLLLFPPMAPFPSESEHKFLKECPVCEGGSISKGGLRVHERSGHYNDFVFLQDGNAVQCSQCKKWFNSLTLHHLRSHFSTYHPTISKDQVEIELENAANPKKSIPPPPPPSRSKAVHSTIWWKCKACQVRFPTEGKLQTHNRNEHKRKRGRPSKKDLQMKNKKGIGIEEERSCRKCVKGFRSEELMETHEEEEREEDEDIDGVHDVKKNIRKFKRKSEGKGSAKDVKIVQKCPQCRLYFRPWNLEKHKRTVHELVLGVDFNCEVEIQEEGKA